MRLATTPRELVIESERLVLRPLTADDLDDLVAEVSDLAVSRMLARVPYPYTRRDGEIFLAAGRRQGSADIALSVTEGGRVIGGIGLTVLRGQHEFGYWLGSRHWGKGYATEAGRAFLAHVFDTLPLEQVRSGIFFDNPASLRVQVKLGFREIGRRQVECLARGRKVEHIDTVLTRAVFRRLMS
jgi:RimJ/RimL family protein N-acetyltransferase